MTAESILKENQLGGQGVAVVLEAVLRARTMGADGDSYWKAMALKLQASCHELLGNDEQALQAFDDALRINPKVGVKRKADALRKKLAGRGGIS